MQFLLVRRERLGGNSGVWAHIEGFGRCVVRRHIDEAGRAAAPRVAAARSVVELRKLPHVVLREPLDCAGRDVAVRVAGSVQGPHAQRDVRENLNTHTTRVGTAGIR